MSEQNNAAPELVMGDPRVTANDFLMLNETTQDANNLERALLYLQDSPSASSVIDQASGITVSFNHNDVYADEALADGSGVVWNPDAALSLNNGEYMSPAVNLASEFAHIVLPGGLDQNATADPIWSNSAEAVAHQAANVMAGELGEPLRADYLNVTPEAGFDVTFSQNASNDLGFDYGAFSADYGVTDFGIDSFGTDSFGGGSGLDAFGSGNFGFDYGSFSAEYGVADFGDSFGGGGGGGGSGGLDSNLFMMNTSVGDFFA